jgi:hypothetical protein
MRYAFLPEVLDQTDTNASSNDWLVSSALELLGQILE